MTAHLRGAVYANFKDISRKQEIRKENKLRRKSIIDSQERVLKIIAAIKGYKSLFAFSSTRKFKLKNIVTGSAVGSETITLKADVNLFP